MSDTLAEIAPFFESQELNHEIYESAIDAAHRSFRAREAFEARLSEFESSRSHGGADHLRIGLGKLALGKYQESLEHLSKASDVAMRYWYAADALIALGKLENAKAALHEAAGKGWDAFACDMRTVELLVRGGDLAAAGKLIKKHEARGVDRGEWYYARALVADAELDRVTAAEMYNKASTLSPDHPSILFRAAYLADLLGNDRLSVDLYERLARRPRAQINALINLAVVYEDAGKYEKAADCLRRVLKAFPNHLRARQFLKDVESGIELIAEESRVQRVDPRQALLDQSVVDFELSVRARNCLKKMNIRTLGELIKLSEPELLAYKNFGETSLDEIKAILSKRGLRLGMAIEEIDMNAIQAAQAAAPPAPEPPKVVIPPGREAALSKPVAELELSVRARRCLQRLNVNTVGDLLGHTEEELLATRNFGQTSLTEIRAKLDTLGLKLATKRGG
ncbi:MAG: DNA-directed RNA polymerase subunit alpha C-terminal domain-containing protein [Phycisphaerae bacterium]|nr:DNA-directed RNA polymerase subunit alpha C-terminal domain-containing protein [Phycisphaerae bacterium]